MKFLVPMLPIILLSVSAGLANVLGQQPAPAPPTRLIDYVPAALLSTNQADSDQAEPDPQRKSLTDRHLVQPRDQSSAARWRRFEAEFGIQQPSRSWVKGSLQNAKYQLDEAVFAVKEFLDHDLNFDYAVRDLFGGASSSGAADQRGGSTAAKPAAHPLLGLLDQARLKSQIGFNDELKGFVGIKLVLPIND